MSENGDPYENASAERMNRTIKEEFGLLEGFFPEGKKPSSNPRGPVHLPTITDQIS
jgi:hypothetical protein